MDWAENGSKAVDQFEASDPGSYFAIFMDMQMPVMDGIEATKKIRNSVREDNDVPICDDSKYLCNGPQAVRGRGHISKPVNLKEIQTTLDEKVRTACAG